MSELGMWPTPMQKTEQASENSNNLAAPAASEARALDAPTQEAEATPAAEQPWTSASEEEWDEHRATSWALAYVIHRIRSTPHPPILTPQQRRHFEKIVEMAAALIAEWQGHERDLAQQLGTRRPITELATQPLNASQGQLDDADDELWTRQAFTAPLHLFLGEDDEPEAPSTDVEKTEAPEASVSSAIEDDYQI